MFGIGSQRQQGGYVSFEAAGDTFVDGNRGQVFTEHADYRAGALEENEENQVKLCIDTTFFNYVLLSVILMNTVVIALETVFIHEESYQSIFGYLELAFTVFYVIEVSFRLICGGLRFFFCGADMMWNLMDLSITTIAVIDTVLHIMFHSSKSAAAVGRLFRIFRIFRIARIARVVQDSPSMFGVDMLGWVDYLLMTTITAAMNLAVLVSLVIFVFAIMVTHMLWDDEHPEVAEKFGNLGTSMWSLFKIMTLDNWSDDVSMVLEYRPDMRIFFVIFVFAAAIALMSLVPAIFIEMHLNAMQAEQAEADRQEEQIRRRKEAKMLHLLYKVIDIDQSGTVSGSEIQETITDRKIVERLQDAGLKDEDDLRDVKLKLFEMWTDFFEDNVSSEVPEEEDLTFEVTEDAFVDSFLKKRDDISLSKLWRVITSTRMRIRTDYNELHKLVAAAHTEIHDLQKSMLGEKHKSAHLSERDDWTIRDLEERATKAESVSNQAEARVEEIRQALLEVDSAASASVASRVSRKSERSPYRNTDKQSDDAFGHAGSMLPSGSMRPSTRAAPR